ncbi:Response regulator rcp1 [Planctomycetes bacterium Pan216]|uniref:Response regulator rcp1 n=1 Tax=Kolteria novifilia TaxID=2527975 RepID=A0A518BBG0_9BACT|nr:Response regulator rcp1 [Planctomycetes bacterium Pan216]
MTSSRPITVLLAEDDPDDQLMAKKAWEQARILNPLEIVDNGEELLDCLRQRGRFADTSKERPGLVLLDLNMPRMDGREALAEIKSDASLRRIPVIILTTSKADEDVLQSYDLGVNSYIAKPVTFDSLVDVIKGFEQYWIHIVALPPDSQPAD